MSKVLHFEARVNPGIESECYEAVFDALEAFTERLSVPSVLGVLRLISDEISEDAREPL
jgi:hypothetical protein